MAVEYLDTGKFNDAISALKDGIEEYNSIKSEVEKTTSNLFNYWQGLGKIQFEKDFTTIYRQLEDIADIMYELYDSLVEASATYLETDQLLAKQFTV